MTDGKFCAKCLSQYKEILPKPRLMGTEKTISTRESRVTGCRFVQVADSYT